MFNKTEARRDLRTADRLRQRLRETEARILRHRSALMTETGLRGVNEEILRRELAA